MSRRYLSTQRLAELEHALGPRDWAILATLAHLRLASGRQLERLYFVDLTRRRAQQSLASLVARGVLARLPRTVGGVRAGSAGHVYTMGPAGLRLTTKTMNRRARTWNIGLPFLAHSLTVSELYTRLVEADRAGVLELREFMAEPACWRSFSGPHGRAVLKPDAHLIVRLGEFEDQWYVEADRGSESTTTLARKCEQYRRYWQTGTEQARTGIFPRVLFLVPDAKRHDVLVNVFGRQPEAVWPLFTVALFDDAVSRIAQGAEK
jgi:hypothetical protein